MVVAALFAGAPPARADAARITKGPWAQRVTETSAIVRVEVDPPGPVTLELAPGSAAAEGDGGAKRSLRSDEARSLHTLSLGELAPATRYTYQLRSGGSAKIGAFTTAPAPARDTSFHFLVFGDNRTDDAAHAAVVRAMVPVAGDFLVHTGDFVENGGSLVQWQTFFDIEAPLIGSRCLFSAVGNHELSDKSGIEYARFFGPTDPVGPVDVRKGKNAPAASRPEHLNGTFRWGNARFFLLNGMVSYKSSVDRAWLEKALQDADGERDLAWRIVVTHHGPWSSGPHGSNIRLADAGIPDVLRQHKVDLVISGHDHIYERGWAGFGGGGIAYLVSGGGGAPTYPIKHRAPQARKVESVRHFVDVGVTAGALHVSALRTDGSTLDRCSLVREPFGWDCDGASPGAAASAGEGASSGAAGASSVPASATPRSSACACRTIGAKRASGHDAMLALAGGAVAVVITRCRRRARAGRSQ